MITTPTYTEKLCPSCGRLFSAHPNAIYCSIACSARAARQRRSARQQQGATDESPYQLTLTDITPEMLTTLYANTSRHIYPKDIRIDGPIPPHVARPSDIILENLGDHHVIYHKSRLTAFP